MSSPSSKWTILWKWLPLWLVLIQMVIFFILLCIYAPSGGGGHGGSGVDSGGGWNYFLP